MPNLRFDTDAGRDMAGRMGACADAIEGELQSVMGAVESLVPGAWEANAANQFSEQMHNWAGEVRRAVQALQELQQRLNAEIEEWEATAASF